MLQVVSILALAIVAITVSYHFAIFLQSRKDFETKLIKEQQDRAVGEKQTRELSTKLVSDAKTEVNNRVTQESKILSSDISKVDTRLTTLSDDLALQFKTMSESIVSKAGNFDDLTVKNSFNVTNKKRNVLGDNAFPDANGDVRINPLANKNAYIGTKSKANQIGQDTWLPHSDGNAYIRPNKVDGQVNLGDFKTKAVRVGLDTWLPHSDGNAYIRPNIANGQVSIGDIKTRRINIGNKDSDTRIRGRLRFGLDDDNSDPYSLQKVVNGADNSALRITLNDNKNESLQIWGDSCSQGNCAGPGVESHRFTVTGDAIHQGKVCIKNTCLNEGNLKKLISLGA
jgi:hypothetical protein